MARHTVKQFQQIAHSRGFEFEATGQTPHRYELYSNKYGGGSTACYETLDEAYSDICDLIANKNPLDYLKPLPQ